jgi:hypothetical protein
MSTFVLAEFATPERMLDAARRVREAGFSNVDTHSPYPVEGTAEALALPKSQVPLFTLIGGVTGALTGYLMQWWCNGVDYPIVVGNRPPLSYATWWLPNNIPITFELGVLFGSFAAFFGFFFTNRLPRPYHPVFDLESFRTATVDRFWVSVATEDPAREQADITAHLEAAGAARVAVVSDPGKARAHHA